MNELFVVLDGSMSLEDIKNTKIVKREYEKDGEKRQAGAIDLGDKLAFQYTDKKTGQRMWSVSVKQKSKVKETR